MSSVSFKVHLQQTKVKEKMIREFGSGSHRGILRNTNTPFAPEKQHA